MSSLADRLRGILKPPPPVAAQGDVRSKQNASGDPAGIRTAGNDPADVLGGHWCDQFLVVDRRYSPGHRHGRVAIADAAPSDDGWRTLPLLGAGVDGGRGRYLFLDLETTGLAGGAGTYAFLVGIGWFDACSFHVRQFFLASYAAERMLLQALAALAADGTTVVTFNGKSFDLPVLETRYVMHRMPTPFAGMPHVDMLHPARRLWRGASDEREGNGGCRLGVLEQVLCGHERQGDVPGFEIPSRYFHFVRTGESRQLAAVLEHNRLDLLSLAVLTARAVELLEAGPGAAQTPREAMGIGQTYERAGLLGQARAAFARAADLPRADAETRAEALRALALVCRRLRAYGDAAEAWRTVLGLRDCPAAIRREAAEALAIHHEHRLRDPRTARTFALESLRLPVTQTRREKLQHRLARLDRKLGTAGAEVAALF